MATLQAFKIDEAIAGISARVDASEDIKQMALELVGGTEADQRASKRLKQDTR